jgi:CspA family cold shock protein
LFLKQQSSRKDFPVAGSHNDSKDRNGGNIVAQYKGQVKWFNNAKGYGFLGVQGGADVFCHYSSLQMDGYKSLKEGDEVEFDIIAGETGKPQADKVVRTQLHDVIATLGENEFSVPSASLRPASGGLHSEVSPS